MHRFLGFAIFFFSFAAVVAAYLIATLSQGLPFFLPSISETADLPPASSVFTCFMGLGNFLITIAVYIRFKDLDATLVDASARRLNAISLASGVIMSASMHIVTSFQQASSPYIHYPAAVLLFWGSVFYMWFCTFISTHLRRHGLRPELSNCTIYFRYSAAAAQTSFILASGVFSLLWYLKHESSIDSFWWSLNAICEYSMAVCLGFFFISLFPEFRRLRIDVKIAWTPEGLLETSPLLN